MIVNESLRRTRRDSYIQYYSATYVCCLVHTDASNLVGHHCHNWLSLRPPSRCISLVWSPVDWALFGSNLLEWSQSLDDFRNETHFIQSLVTQSGLRPVESLAASADN